MELVKVRIKGEPPLYILNRSTNRIKEGKSGKTFEYFIRGKGHFKTKAFEVVENHGLPDVWDKSITWLDVAKFYDQYGIEVAEGFANSKTAGIVARQTARGYGLIYKAIKDLVDENFNPAFFELLRCDYMLSCFGMFTLDIAAFDKGLAKIDPDYNDVKCTYKRKKNVSCRQYVELKYGAKYVEVIDRLNKEENIILS